VVLVTTDDKVSTKIKSRLGPVGKWSGKVNVDLDLDLDRTKLGIISSCMGLLHAQRHSLNLATVCVFVNGYVPVSIERDREAVESHEAR
jgi:hypothetical protein